MGLFWFRFHPTLSTNFRSRNSVQSGDDNRCEDQRERFFLFATLRVRLDWRLEAAASARRSGLLRPLLRLWGAYLYFIYLCTLQMYTIWILMIFHISKKLLFGQHPRAIRFEDITAAAYRIRDGIFESPCEVRNLCWFANYSRLEVNYFVACSHFRSGLPSQKNYPAMCTWRRTSSNSRAPSKSAEPGTLYSASRRYAVQFCSHFNLLPNLTMINVFYFDFRSFGTLL